MNKFAFLFATIFASVTAPTMYAAYTNSGYYDAAAQSYSQPGYSSGYSGTVQTQQGWVQPQGPETYNYNSYPAGNAYPVGTNYTYDQPTSGANPQIQVQVTPSADPRFQYPGDSSGQSTYYHGSDNRNLYNPNAGEHLYNPSQGQQLNQESQHLNQGSEQLNRGSNSSPNRHFLSDASSTDLMKKQASDPLEANNDAAYKVKRALQNDSSLSISARNVQVSLNRDGELSLTGIAKSQTEKDKIEKIARQTSGEDNISNQIKVANW